MQHNFSFMIDNVSFGNLEQLPFTIPDLEFKLDVPGKDQGDAPIGEVRLKTGTSDCIL